MTDLIERQAVIDALQKEINKGIPPFDDVMGSIRCGVRLARNIIEDLPSVRTGKWTRHFDGNEWYWYCSSCKEQWYEEDLWMGGNSFPNFCPNCGADMRPQFEEPEINPCRGCEDYDWKGGCKSKGGCAKSRGEVDE